jgi:site-specific DNA recombinase
MIPKKKSANSRQRVAIYSRVSTEEQAKEGLSVDAQIEKCKSFCNARDWEIFKVYKDAGFSAGTLDRPAMELLLRDADEQKFDIILVYKIDRFSRKLRDLIMVLETLKDKGINFTSVTEQIDTTSAMGEAFFQIIGVFAQLERGMVKERVKLAFDRKIQLGDSLNRAPLGYVYSNKKLIPDLQTQDQVKEIFEMSLAGVSYREICGKFGISKSAFYSLIKNPVYLGKIKYKGALYSGNHKPIIEEELFKKVNNLSSLDELGKEVDKEVESETPEKPSEIEN